MKCLDPKRNHYFQALPGMKILSKFHVCFAESLPKPAVEFDTIAMMFLTWQMEVAQHNCPYLEITC